MIDNSLLFWENIRYFRPREFASPDAFGSGINIDPSIVIICDVTRNIVKVPLIILSGIRTAKYNRKIKGSKNSAHLRGYAVDIRALSPRLKFNIVNTALFLKVRRIGVYEKHVHLDTDPNLMQDIIWYGKYKPKK